MTEPGERSQAIDLAALYLDLLKKAVTHSLYGRTAQVVPPPKGRIKRVLVSALSRRDISLVRIHPYRDEVEGVGRQWPAPAFAHTMVGKARLENVQSCIERIIADGIPGDLIEAGVWRGGVGILMRAVLKVHGVTDRCIWLADSFEGLPPPDLECYPADAGSTLHTINSLAVSLDEVRGNFARYGLLDDQVRFLKGWFRDTLPELRNKRWSLVRLDGDLYESTMDGLTNLYPNLCAGGYVIVDDYVHEPCRRAVDDFRRSHGVNEPVQQIDWTGVYWRRES